MGGVGGESGRVYIGGEMADFPCEVHRRRGQGREVSYSFIHLPFFTEYLSFFRAFQSTTILLSYWPLDWNYVQSLKINPTAVEELLLFRVKHLNFLNSTLGVQSCFVGLSGKCARLEDELL